MCVHTICVQSFAAGIDFPVCNPIVLRCLNVSAWNLDICLCVCPCRLHILCVCVCAYKFVNMQTSESPPACVCIPTVPISDHPHMYFTDISGHRNFIRLHRVLSTPTALHEFTDTQILMLTLACH